MQKTNIQKWLLKTNLIATNDMVKQKKIPWHVFVTLMEDLSYSKINEENKCDSFNESFPNSGGRRHPYST